MPVAIIIVAIVLIAAGIRGSYRDLFELLKGDFTGSGNFLNWLVAIGLVGVIGYIPKLQSFSRAFIALIIVAIFIKNGSGVFDQFVSSIQGASPGDPHPNPGNPGTTSDSSLTGAITGALGLPSLPSAPIFNPYGTSNSFINGGGLLGMFGFQ